MTESPFRPNWASAPGETIQEIIVARGISTARLQSLLDVQEPELNRLLTGNLEISEPMAARLSETLGSTTRFWLERDRQFHAGIKELELALPDLARWVRTFPVSEMVNSGWFRKPSSKAEAASDLLEYFGVSTLAEWREEYQSRLKATKFRTSETFDNSIASTTAWIRHGEITAEQMNCGPFKKEQFHQTLHELKGLTLNNNPREFIPALRQSCAESGVAVVVARCTKGCAASGATCILESGTALLLLSARFLSDDQFWFSFFHEAGHLILHTDGTFVEEKDAEQTEQEYAANKFAQETILSPLSEDELLSMQINKFSIVRFARRCGVSAGLIVGQLQHRRKIRPSAFNAMKVRYEAKDVNLGNVLG